MRNRVRVGLCENALEESHRWGEQGEWKEGDKLNVEKKMEWDQ